VLRWSRVRLLHSASSPCALIFLCPQVDARPVAIKRLLRTAQSVSILAISLLIRSDGHPNVVRYFACEETPDFIFLALERWCVKQGGCTTDTILKLLRELEAFPPPTCSEDSLAAVMAGAARARAKHAKRVAAGNNS